MKSNELWLTYCGKNQSGFKALPSGIRAAKCMFGFNSDMAEYYGSRYFYSRIQLK
jgi:hypothetical protein